MRSLGPARGPIQVGRVVDQSRTEDAAAGRPTPRGVVRARDRGVGDSLSRAASRTCSIVRDRDEAELALRLLRNLLEVREIAFGDDHRRDAGAERRERLLAHAADRKHTAAQRDFAGHRDVGAHGTFGSRATPAPSRA
jgi:hypothetical protein